VLVSANVVENDHEVWMELDAGHETDEIVPMVRDENEFLVNDPLQELTILHAFPAAMRDAIRFEAVVVRSGYESR
jgi:hypothetical protein